MLKIAFLFLTISGINHEDHWKDFFKNNEKRYSIYIHSKKPFPNDSIFKKNELSNKVSTKWGHLIKAEVALLKEALNDPDNQKFIFCSESTLPLQDFNKIYNHVFSSQNSIFPYFVNPHQNPKDRCYKKRNLNLIPKKFRYKNPQWIILNRKHAELMVKDTTIIDIISKYEADDELYPATFLAINHLLNEIDFEETTYVNWQKKTTKIKVLREFPFTFSDFSDPEEYALIEQAINKNFLFARKFSKNCDLSYIDHLLSYKN